jgi:hypothetical protein
MKVGDAASDRSEISDSTIIATTFVVTAGNTCMAL